MIQVKPMPNELAVAHEGRIGWINMCTRQREVNELLNQGRPRVRNGRERSPPSRLFNLASHSEMSTRDYARQHSMLSSLKFAAVTDVPYGDQSPEKLPQLLEMQTQRAGAYCCIDCVNEDINHWKFSWFRRSHHLIGVDWCQVHGRVLHAVSDRNPFVRSPHQWLALSKLKEIETSHAELPASGIVRRYVDIATAFLERERPFKNEDINPRIGNRARELGLCLMVARPHLISEFIEKRVNKKWLADNFKDFAYSNPPSRQIDSIATRLNTGSSGHVYALALAALYDSSEQALTALFSKAGGGRDGTDLPNGMDKHSVIASDSRLERALQRFHKGQSVMSACSAEGIEASELESYIRQLTSGLIPSEH